MAAVAERAQLTKRRRDNAGCFSVCVAAMAGTVVVANICSLVSLSAGTCPTVDVDVDSDATPGLTCIAQGYKLTTHGHGNCPAKFSAPTVYDECGGPKMACLLSNPDTLHGCTCNRNDGTSDVSWPAWQNTACLAAMSMLVVALGWVLVRLRALPFAPFTRTLTSASATRPDPVAVSEVLMAHAFIGLAFYFAAAQGLNYARLQATVWPIVAVDDDDEPGPTVLAKGALIPVAGAMSTIASVGCVIYGTLVLAGHESRSRAAQTALAAVVFSSSVGSLYAESVETNVFASASATGSEASDLTDHMYAVGVTGVVFGVIGVVCSVSALFTLRGSTWGSPPAQSLTLLWIGFAFNEGVSPGVKAFILTSMQSLDTCHHYACTPTLVLSGMASFALAVIALSMSCLHNNEPVSKIDFRQAAIGGVPMAGGTVPLLFQQAANAAGAHEEARTVAMTSPTVFRRSTHVTGSMLTAAVYEGDDPMLVAGGQDTARPGGSDMHW